MTEQEFWRLIKLLDFQSADRGDWDASIAPLVTELGTRSESEVEQFYELLAQHLFKLDTEAHFEASDTESEDGFLYARCYVVAKGQDLYQQALKNAKKMPRGLNSFEQLLWVPSRSWAIATQRDPDEFEYRPKVSYESGSNKDGWGPVPVYVRNISLRDSNRFVRQLHELDPTHLNSIALKYGVLGEKFIDALYTADFQTAGFCNIVITLDPDLESGSIAHQSGDQQTERFTGGIEPASVIRSKELDRITLFIDVIAGALYWLADRDNLDRRRIDTARQFVIDLVSRRSSSH